MYGNKYLEVLKLFSQLSIFWQLQIKGARPICIKLGKKNQKNYNVRHDIEINHLFHDKLIQVFHNKKMSQKVFLKGILKLKFLQALVFASRPRGHKMLISRSMIFLGDDTKQIAIIKETFLPHLALKKYES